MPIGADPGGLERFELLNYRDATLITVYNRLPLAARGGGEPPVSTSFAAYRASQVSNTGWAFPEAELRQMFAENSDGSGGSYQASTVSQRLPIAVNGTEGEPPGRRS